MIDKGYWVYNNHFMVSVVLNIVNGGNGMKLPSGQMVGDGGDGIGDQLMDA